MMEPILVIGGGLAGSEATWQIAKRGGKVILYEMKPQVYSSAHRSPFFAELVCSNSLKSESLENASGILKEELQLLDSLILKTAKETRVPAGESLAVDRELFSRKITEKIENIEGVEIIREEVKNLPQDRVSIIATGPLTAEALANEIQKVTGSRALFFYDAISPIVTYESVNLEKTFRASRYGKGGEDYLNCPMDEETYYRFVDELVRGEKVPLRDFEKRYLFEGCLPIEELAMRGKATLAFGPLRPVGLIDAHTGKQPFAVVQLRQEDEFGTLYNLVGFQTRLKQREQKRIFQMIPGLEEAEFVRWGSVHRNTFIDSPQLLLPTLQLKNQLCIYMAGQIIGVEGYLESTAMGLVAGLNALRQVKGEELVFPPRTTAIGSLLYYVTHSQALPFQPMNMNFGLFPPLEEKVKGQKKRIFLGARALASLREWKERYRI
ncbi:MAG: methylenetetrahydrofolate--tRNA-(uracil(54)-C(5))-methyltransferase (FADH(2)-oxidizing) TrmFO [Thermodesulfobacteriota bacterium]